MEAHDLHLKVFENGHDIQKGLRNWFLSAGDSGLR
jgi:hypothetical protein